ncbi:MAG TPA: SDR family oxidoreductase [Streptosporangiaceae bacterium]|nr:SDR family oxidoreductase [Streptosporangiaceae bacterium]
MQFEILERAVGVEVLPVDVTRRTDLEQLVATAVERFERLDVLVSNAGIARTGPVVKRDAAYLRP